MAFGRGDDRAPAEKAASRPMTGAATIAALHLLQILLVGDMFHPVDRRAVDESLNCDVGHGRIGCAAVPVLDAGFGPDDVAGGDVLSLSTPLLYPTRTGGDDQRLTRGMGVPGGPGARCEGDFGRAEVAAGVGVE